jgi:hypothetical protein
MNGRGTLVYVHGASDRGAQVAGQVARIERQLAVHQMALDVVAAEWGDAYGATLDRIDLAIPSAAGALTAAAAGEEDPLLELVRDGPLAELRRLGATSEPGPAEVLTAHWPAEPGDRSAEAASRLAIRDADRLLAVARSVFGDAVRAAADVVAQSPEYAGARSGPTPEVELVAATARSIAATVARQTAPASVKPGLPAPATMDAARSVESGLAKVVLIGAVATLLVGYAGLDPGPGLKRWATDVLVPQRADVMHQTLLGVSDVLLYQRNGEPIRRFVADVLARARRGEGPVVALGESLGSIILVNALMAAGAPRPDLVVTVGSQASLLQTIGALADPGSPPPFQPWLNIYDRRDLVAFVAAPVWPDQPGISDVAIDTGLGFPDSHGATYLSEPTVYDAIRDHPALNLAPPTA